MVVEVYPYRTVRKLRRTKQGSIERHFQFIWPSIGEKVVGKLRAGTERVKRLGDDYGEANPLPSKKMFRQGLTLWSSQDSRQVIGGRSQLSFTLFATCNKLPLVARRVSSDSRSSRSNMQCVDTADIAWVPFSSHSQVASKPEYTECVTLINTYSQFRHW